MDYQEIYTNPYKRESSTVPVTREEYFQEIHQHLESRHFKDLSTRVSYVQSIKFKCKVALLSDSEFSWINIKDSRQILWLWLQLYFNRKVALTTLSRSETGRHKEAIRAIDTMKLSTEQKLAYLLDLKSKWMVQIAIDARELSWLRHKDKGVCLWAERYVGKQNKPPIDTILSNLCLDPYLLVMGYIDTRTNEYKFEFIRKLKSAWIQKNHRKKVVDKSKNASTIKLSQKHAMLLTEIVATINTRAL
ncbi:hypothetical protein [Psychromonas sp. MME2]|uniref:hypothetical protein n=1 Tax=Psychromonas sp. MME2 TaxID=3231033 RepID=UPI00339C1AC5